MSGDKEKCAGKGEVLNCVSNLVHAFTDGLNIFKRLRERRRRKKKSKHKQQGGTASASASSAELELSNSLRRGPQDIQERYQRCYGEKGERFARGDSIAHASLAETLIKLNTGLVSIIATFLTHDSKKSHLDLDYKSLTNLSDVSRREAMQSLNELYQRLSMSQLQVHRMASPKTDMEKRKHAGSKQKVNGHTVARVPGKSASQTQLVFVRPKNGRKSSSSSSSSSKSPSPSTSTALSSPCASPLGSPLPQYALKDPFPPQKVPVSKISPAPGRKRVDSFNSARPVTWPQVTLDDKCSPPREKRMPPPPAVTAVTATVAANANMAKRRADKATPSTYTFASDSTKLGEIPQRSWTVPWDYEEAERLNAEAAMTGYAMPVVDERRAKKKGLFGFLKKGGQAA